MLALADSHDNLRVIFAHTGDDLGELGGHFAQHHLDEGAPWHRAAETFLCGPPALMSAVRARYDEVALGEHLHAEQFTLSSPMATGAETGGTVSFSGSDASAQNCGATLLEQAEAAGLSPDSAAGWVSAFHARGSSPAAAPEISVPAKPIAAPTPGFSCASTSRWATSVSGFSPNQTRNRHD